MRRTGLRDAAGRRDRKLGLLSLPCTLRRPRGSPQLECRIRAATRWEGRIVKEAYDTIAFWGASDPGEGCTIEDLGTLSDATVTREGYWRSDCVSPNYTGEYARYYSFVLTRARDVRIDLESPSVDTWLDLRQGAGTSGPRVATDDDGGTGTNARIDTRLDAGTYTIEATTLRRAQSGPFTLTVRTAGDGPDRAALVALYEATNGSDWVDSANWLSDAPLGSWFGVTTGANGRVTKLELPGNPLRGPIPPELGNLAFLEVLNFGAHPVGGWLNELSGPIPSSLGNLANLRHLSLWGNELSGPIPDSFGNLANLEFLGLPYNQLSGTIPAELGNLANLEALWLEGNQLSGTIPAELGNLAKLTFLALDSHTGLCLDPTFPLASPFARLAQDRGISVCATGNGFTDDPIVPGETPVKAVHFTELRERIDVLRGAHGLGRFPWTDSTLVVGVTSLRGVHISELRTALGQAYDAASRTIGFGTEPVQAGRGIRAEHISELRRAVTALE